LQIRVGGKKLFWKELVSQQLVNAGHFLLRLPNPLLIPDLLFELLLYPKPPFEFEYPLFFKLEPKPLLFRFEPKLFFLLPEPKPLLKLLPETPLLRL
jgi:hypothetical protein